MEIPVVRHCKFCGRTHLPLESFKATQKLCRYRSTRKHTETENCILVTLGMAMSVQTTTGRNGDRFDAHPLEARADVARVLSPAFASVSRASNDDHVFLLLFRRHFSGDRTFFRVDGREARTHR